VDRLGSRCVIAAAVFVLIHLATAFWDIPFTWGVHLFRFFPVWTVVLFSGLSGLLLWLAVQRGPGGWPRLPTGSLDCWRSRYGVNPCQLVICGGGGVLFFLTRSATHLLGDGYLHMHELPLRMATGIESVSHEPLSHSLISILYRAGVIWEISPELTFQIFSIIAGILFWWLSFRIASLLGRDSRTKWLVFGLLSLGGQVQLFAGYVETYALILPGCLAYLVFCLLVLRGRLPLWGAAVWLGLIIPLHFIMLTLAPSLVVLAWLQRNEFGQGAKRYLAPVASIGSLLLTTWLVLWLLDVEPLVYLGKLRGSHFLPLLAEPDFFQAYHLFSWRHLLDLANLLLLVAPGMVLLLFLIPWRRLPVSAEHRFLVLSCLAPLLFLLLVNPEVGMFRDWDVLSLLIFPATVAVVGLLVDRIIERPELLRVTITIMVVAALHTVAWVGLNTQAEAATARFRYALETCHLSRHATAYGWETLGHYYRDIENDRLAAYESYEQAVRTDEFNPRYWNLAGSELARIGRLASAEEYLLKAIDLREVSDAESYNNLAYVYVEMEKHEVAVECLQQAVALEPTYRDAWHSLGNELLRLGRYDEALESFERAIEIQPEFPVLYLGRGAALTALGAKADAAQAFEQAVRLCGTSSDSQLDLQTALRNLGIVYYELRQYERAIQVWQRYLLLTPNASEVLIRLGCALVQIGNIPEAERCLDAVLALEPGHSQAEGLRALIRSRAER